ncbi:methionine ABC transporter ATP-binding protein [Lachnobacterium bovis]|uniref:D-methionine transport system ATP-binding protein n=1 Tax=Lachnobacterium bovis TaxID=140626 RepID=A0A1H9TDW6_9FIRM|nr:ATP-binding cassette domain-containing protein [Lachnobacterium bovis]SER95164.1 D-methionine transport system ATP-binding protein [Lachnobacterium bovis]
MQNKESSFNKQDDVLIEFEDVCKVYQTSKGQVNALNNINLKIKKGSICGIIGLSGAGKSTLVRCINLLEKPTSGKVILNGVNLMDISEKELRQKRQKIGMIFQHFNLLEQRTALDNICFSLELAGISKKEARSKAMKYLEIVDLVDRKDNYPSQLSGGQKQRIAIARALATEPEVLLCDEATSALDPTTTSSILDLLKDINEKLGVTVVIITHEMRVVEKICNHVVVVNQGEIVEEGDVKEVFLLPKSKYTKQMLYPNLSNFDEINSRKIFRISFDGQSSYEPVIANLVLKCQAKINILGASTENVGGKAFGQMLIEMPKDENVLEKVKSYLDEIHINYEEDIENEC